MLYKILKSSRAGFSLMEIIIALMIVGLMATLGLGMMKWIKEARRTRTETDLKNLQLAITSFNGHTGTYPVTLLDLANRPTDAAIAKKWHGLYAEEKELKDAWGAEFQYHINPKGAKRPYTLFSWGPNGEGSPEGDWINVWEE